MICRREFERLALLLLASWFLGGNSACTAADTPGDVTRPLPSRAKARLVGEKSVAPVAFTALAFSPDGTLLATGSRDDVLRVWDLARKTKVLRLTGHGSGGVAFSPDGKTLASVSLRDSVIRLWEPVRGRETARIPVIQGPRPPGGIMAIAYSPQGSNLAVGCI